MNAAPLTRLLFLLLLLPAVSPAQKGKGQHAAFNPASRPRNLSDSALVELVQKQTFRYFRDFAHPVSGMARERSNQAYGYGNEVVTTGGTGFGLMALIVGAERGWVTRQEAAAQVNKIVDFLLKADHYHGLFAHWLNGSTGKTIPFSRRDDGADIVESSYLFMGLLAAREYFTRPEEEGIRNKIGWMWGEADWNWHTRETGNVLYWHWSPNHGWAMNHEIRGWNECLITYVLAASSPTHPIPARAYHNGYTHSRYFFNRQTFYGIPLPLGFDFGGPLFFAHYSFMGLDPHGLQDQYADYWTQNLNHTLINREHCVRNPKGFTGYGPQCWGLTASDNHEGYNAHAPDNDLGVISPTAALSSFPYTPKYSMEALRHFYDKLGDRIWSAYGFVDAFNESKNWYATSHLAIDQGPIIVMMENYRSGLLWKLFMNNRDIQRGLKTLGFRSPYLKEGEKK